jgi:hypothetical protein
MNKRTFLVEGWLEGSNYDLGLPADDVVSVDALNESAAEDLGEKKLDKSVGKCEVIVATVCD